jgi:hypothetical protein
MATVTRNQFVELSRGGGQIDVDRMPPALSASLAQEGVTDGDLRKIAGQDHVIRGEAEFQALFDRLDSIDRNGSASSIATTEADGRSTASGRVFEALKSAVETSRARALAEGGARFVGEPTLERVARGETALGAGSPKEAISRVQQALIDVGSLRPDHGVDGVYDSATMAAVRRFQRDAGVHIDGGVGRETLSALAAMAPPPGEKIDRSPEYDQLFRDGRVGITIAVGYDEDGAHSAAETEIPDQLVNSGYQEIDAGNPIQRYRYGLDDSRYDPNARYFAREFQDEASGRDVTAVVRFIHPGEEGDAAARASFLQAMRQDEVVMYNGHARYGTGPDFDPMRSVAGNVVIDPHGNRRHQAPPAGLRESIRGRPSDLGSITERPSYQLLVLNGCYTEEYLHNLRNPSLFQASMVDTDIIATQEGPRYGWSGEPALRFLEGLTRRESNDSMFASQAQKEQAYLRASNLEEEVEAAGHTFVESGFLGNAANRRMPASEIE